SLAIFRQRTGTEFTLVPFSGNQPSLNALMRGDVNLASDSPFATRPLLEANKIRPVAVTTARRSSILPDVPAFGEYLPGYDVPFWMEERDRKSTRLNSSHVKISYAVVC